MRLIASVVTHCSRSRRLRLSAIGWSVLFGCLGFSSALQAVPAQTPLNISTGTKANLLMVLDNSNSMDEEPSGQAAGSNNPDSKSEIARNVIKTLIDQYTNRLNMGLMTYQQQSPIPYHIHKSTYDASYNPANYDPNFSGDRASATKRNRIANPSDPNRFIYYNVGLPYYSPNNDGDAFCYSPDSIPFRNGEVYPAGPWDSYRCFGSKTGVSDTLPTWGNAASEALHGYGTYIFQSQLSPTDSDLAQGILDFGKQQTWHHVGKTYFSNSSPGRGFLNVPVKDLDVTHAAALKAALACNIPDLPGACLASGIKNAGLTPIQGTLNTALDYFKNRLSSVAEGFDSGSTYPLPVSCNKDFVVLLTDGLPSTDSSGHVVTDPVAALQAAATAAAELHSQGIDTYVIGFALPFGTDPSTLNQIAVAGGTGTAYSAQDTATLSSVMNAIIEDILSKSAAFTAVSANSSLLSSDSLIFQATYDSTDWSGRLRAYQYDFDSANNALIVSRRWDASFPEPSQRKLFTLNATPQVGQSLGLELTWANLAALPSGASQQDYLNKLNGVADGLGEARLSWLRGDRSQEDPNGVLRKRSSILGDIARSTPVYVGTPDYGYGRLPGDEGVSYGSFRASPAYAGRRLMIYAGSNDGYLHGFDASKTADGGKEIFAYLPNSLFPKLSRLMSPGYVHESYVDGPITVKDTYFTFPNAQIGGQGSWRTVLVGSLGAGGRGLFALDVTSPDQFSADKVLWEFDSSSDTTNGPDLGYTLPQPAMAKLQNGKWVTFVANGYDSDNGHAVLFIIDTQTGAVLKKLDTMVGDSTNKNGLSSPLVVDTNKDLLIDTVYAGDLQGNLWKFDVSGQFASMVVPSLPYFVACTVPGDGVQCSAANRQPITSKPVVGLVSKKNTEQNNAGRMIYFGTGKYFEDGDNLVPVNPQIQSFYGLWDRDNGSRISDKAVLAEQQFLAENAFSSSSSQIVRTITANPVCYATTSTGCAGVSPASVKNGWFINLVEPPSLAKGERVIESATVRNRLLTFLTLTPPETANVCTAGGSSSVQFIDPLTGGEPKYVAIDMNGDGKFNSSDQKNGKSVAGLVFRNTMAIGLLDLKVGQGNTVTSGESGISLFNSNGGGSNCPPGKHMVYFNDANAGNVGGQCVNDSESNTPLSWRQLR